jgi:hypothetical protein
MATTRIEARCELGQVFTKDNGCESVEFLDLTDRPCKLFQQPGSDNVVLHLGDCYRVLARWQQESLVATLGRLLESRSMVQAGDEIFNDGVHA